MEHWIFLNIRKPNVWHGFCDGSAFMDKDLQRYLNGHLAGSHCVLSLIGELARRQTDARECRFFAELQGRVENDQQILKYLLSRIGCEESSGFKAVGEIGGKVSRMVLLYEGMEPGKLGSFESLEMLALGIQGKRLLWVALQEVAHHFPEWSEIDFQNLEFEAIRQREEVEERRLVHGREALASSLRKGVAEAPAA